MAMVATAVVVATAAVVASRQRRDGMSGGRPAQGDLTGPRQSAVVPSHNGATGDLDPSYGPTR